MQDCSGIQYINDKRSLTGYGDTKDSALNDLLEKFKNYQNQVKCSGTCPRAGEICRPFLNPPDAVKFRVYWPNGSGKIRWKCVWGPGVVEFECACGASSDD